MITAERPSIKDEDTYKALREEGASKEKAARIANAQADKTRNPSKKGGRTEPYEKWAKHELYERAKELDVDGRSYMNKGELIQALRDN